MQPRRATSVLLACLVLASAASADIVIAPASLRQGDPLLAWIVLDALPAGQEPRGAIEAKLVDAVGGTVSTARCFAADALVVPAQPGRSLYGALFALPLELPPGAYELRAEGAAARIAVGARSFPLETVALDEANAKIRTEPSPRKDEEARRLYALIGKVDDGALFAEGSAFVFPAEGGWRSSGFGDARRYLFPNGGSEKSVHAGIDWAVVAGTAVRACARGKVVLAADRAVTGKSVILEHLPGLYSLYYHLSSIEVREGDIAERGGRIAFSGSTGMSTGPHLHWELRARGEAVDPEYWLALPLLDKAAVAAIMNGLIEGR